MRILSFFISCLVVSLNVCALEPQTDHHLLMGVNTYYRDYSEQAIAPFKSDEYGILYGLILGYEYKAPNAIMVSLDVGVDYSKTRYDGCLISFDGEFLGYHKDKTLNLMIQNEAAFGYTYASDHNHSVTPFMGIGRRVWGRRIDPVTEIYAWEYVVLGIQYDYHASKHLNYGIQAKLMPMTNGTMEALGVSPHAMTLGNKVHYELSFPIVYKQDVHSKNDWRITPYYTYQAFGKSDMVASYFNSYIYEPASRTHAVGVKVQYGLGFW